MRALSAAIERFTRAWNASATPFSWVKSADEILAKAVRKPQMVGLEWSAFRDLE